MKVHKSPSGVLGITTTSELGKLIKENFPELQNRYVSFGSYCYEFDITISFIWVKASELSDQLQAILEVGQQQ